MQLRPYQAAAIERVREYVRAGQRRVVLCAPTGAGKTVIAAALIASAAAKGSRVLAVAHRIELISQLSAHLDRVGVAHGVMQGSRSRDPERAVQVVSIQTILRRRDARPAADIIVVDECHLSLSDGWRVLLGSYPDAVILGLTATPARGDGRPLGDIYQALVRVAEPAELVAQGYLMAPRIFAGARGGPDMRGVHIRAGDYDPSESAERLNDKHIRGRVVEHWLRHARGLRTLLFACGVQHSRDLCAEFAAAGVRAVHLDGTSPAELRADALARLHGGETDIITNCDLFGVGLDVPSLGSVVLARPTRSTVVHLQQIGRVLRPHPGKTAPIVLDHAGNCLRLGGPLAHREWTLSGGLVEQERGARTGPACKICPGCFAVVDLGVTVCPECGASMRAKAPRVVQSAEELRELKAELTARATPDQRAAYWRRLQEQAAEHGYKPGWAWHLWQSRYHCSPPGER